MLGEARIVGLGESAGMFLKQTIDALRVVIQHNLIEGDCREDGIVGRYDDPKTRREQFADPFQFQIRRRGRWRGVRRQLCGPCSGVGDS